MHSIKQKVTTRWRDMKHALHWWGIARLASPLKGEIALSRFLAYYHLEREDIIARAHQQAALFANDHGSDCRDL